MWAFAGLILPLYLDYGSTEIGHIFHILESEDVVGRTEDISPGARLSEEIGRSRIC
jgi:hypothetical protein